MASNLPVEFEPAKLRPRHDGCIRCASSPTKWRKWRETRFMHFGPLKAAQNGAAPRDISGFKLEHPSATTWQLPAHSGGDLQKLPVQRAGRFW